MACDLKKKLLEINQRQGRLNRKCDYLIFLCFVPLFFFVKKKKNKKNCLKKKINKKKNNNNKSIGNLFLYAKILLIKLYIALPIC